MTNKTIQPELHTRLLHAGDPGAIDATAVALRQGQLAVIPTDTVYGVGCDAFNAGAIERLYRVKQRPSEKGIPVLLADPADLARVARAVPAVAQALIARFWPGPLTLIVPRHAALPANISQDANIAVRIPDCDVARAVIRQAGGALATSSANLSGQAPAQSGAEALAALAGRVDVVLDDGPTGQALPSTIIDCTGNEPVVLRQGPLTMAELAKAGLG